MESEILRFTTQVDIAIPQYGLSERRAGKSPEEYYCSDNKLPVMFLYHGGTGISSDWFRFSRIEELSDAKKFIVVCPTAQNSCYMNMAYGPRWFDFINIELYDMVHSMFPASADPKKNFAVGLSMGGYGALKSALTFPEKFAYGAAMSSAAYIPQEAAQGIIPLADGGIAMLGEQDKILGSENDLFAVSERLKKSGRPLPKLFSACGTEDFTYKGNVLFKDHLLSLGFDLTWAEDPGSHTWDYWNDHIRMICDWLPL
jgi:S-formylglutathione hydrolase FrmB